MLLAVVSCAFLEFKICWNDVYGDHENLLLLFVQILVTGIAIVQLIGVFFCGVGYHTYDLDALHGRRLYTVDTPWSNISRRSLQSFDEEEREN